MRISQCAICKQSAPMTDSKKLERDDLCAKCTKNELRRRFGREKRWAYCASCCKECGTTERRHQGRGLCTRCYEAWKRKRDYKVSAPEWWTVKEEIDRTGIPIELRRRLEENSNTPG